MTPLVKTSTSTSALSVWTIAMISPRLHRLAGLLQPRGERAGAHVGAERGHHEVGHQNAISVTAATTRSALGSAASSRCFA